MSSQVTLEPEHCGQLLLVPGDEVEFVSSVSSVDGFVSSVDGLLASVDGFSWFLSQGTPDEKRASRESLARFASRESASHSSASSTSI